MRVVPVSGCRGAPIVARTTDVCIEFHCGTGHRFRTSGVPASVLEEDVDRALGLALRQVYDDLETIADGHCPQCHNLMTWATETVDPTSAAPAPGAVYRLCDGL